MILEGCFCWSSCCDLGPHNCICGNDCEPPWEEDLDPAVGGGSDV